MANRLTWKKGKPSEESRDAAVTFQRLKKFEEMVPFDKTRSGTLLLLGPPAETERLGDTVAEGRTKVGEPRPNRNDSSF